MLIQQRLRDRVTHLCRDDPALVAALTYGSFVSGEADAYSDIEFWLFFDPAAAPDAPTWLAAVGEFQHVVVNEFGAHVVFFPGLIRGEFHFVTAADIPSVRSWPARSGPADRMIVVDRTGELRRALDTLPAQPPRPTTAGEVGELCGRFANWLILAHHVTRRGELLRALDALTHTQRHLLWMTRLTTDSTQHWLTPSRHAETDLPTEVTRMIHGATATADPSSLAAALTANWRLGRSCWRQLGLRHGFAVPEALFRELDQRLGDEASQS
ncbi:hypothetical protein M1L60_08555 [Actinoplanes sp. TRM 88003]|uniref:Lincosamide nucleotidyltransferase-like C-terminal domain-containing protein n=1 Tax=Paractinoplanes aksuensis TaxID=2939490 RepID=A0ABT1DIJ5_9ACTN|nr:hypothetical protein [Actinoplanes aksuensis]MCO8270648.1 hypothetical protein [Actinoplanes aksuensis]